MFKQRCRVKICGITSVADATMVCQAGVDAIGLVFYPGSRRYVTGEQAALIQQSLPPFVTCTGLFMDATTAEVQHILQQVSLDLLQFHGSEPPEYCQQFLRPYIKGFGMRDLKSSMAADHYFNSVTAPYDQAAGYLVDSHAPGAAGGTGKTFDWTQLPKKPKKNHYSCRWPPC